eukprot:scaffold1554_cov117-Skeletonema_marinoi.AAC.5
MASTHIKSLSRGIYPSKLSSTIITSHYKLLIATFTVLDTIYSARVLLAALPDWTSSGHLQRSSMAETHMKSMSSSMYPSNL